MEMVKASAVTLPEPAKMLRSRRSCLLLYTNRDRSSTQPAAERLVWLGEWPIFSLCKWAAVLSHATYLTNNLSLG